MGYESRIYIAKKSPTSFIDETSGLEWAENIVRFDIGPARRIAKKFTEKTKYFIYSNNEAGRQDSEQAVTKDKYGDPLTEMSVDKLINVFEKLSGDYKDYWRFSCLLSLLKSLKDRADKGDIGELLVLHFRY